MAAKTVKKKRGMSDEHKAALAEGREQGRAIRAYLEALEAHKPKRGRKRTAESIQKRLAAIVKEISTADPMTRLQAENALLRAQAENARLRADAAAFAPAPQVVVEAKKPDMAFRNFALLIVIVMIGIGLLVYRDQVQRHEAEAHQACVDAPSQPWEIHGRTCP